MAPRANWKGRIRLGEISCGVALYTAASTTDRIAFHTLNRKTGNRVRSEFVDAETGAVVGKDDAIKGYEVDSGDYVLMEPEEIEAAIPDSDKTMEIQAFLPCNEIDTLYFDRPYYLAPTDPAMRDVYGLIRDGMRKQNVAALARTVLFRRLRTLMIRPQGAGLIANTLNFDYEVRSATDTFSEIADLSLKGEMLELAEHIIRTKSGDFDPTAFDDRYEAALADMVKAKLEGRPLPKRAAPSRDKVVDLLAALRESAGAASPKMRKSRAKSAPRRKAG